MTDPRTRIGMVVCVGLLAVSLEHPFALAVLATACMFPFIADYRQLKFAITVTMGVVWSTVLAQGIFYGQEPRVALLHLGPLTVWREGVVYGLVQSLRVVAVGLAGVGLATRTPPDRLYAALLSMRMPFGLALMAATALRFLPDITDSWLVVRRARLRRGRPAHHRNPWAWLRLEVGLLRPLIARSLRRSWTLAESLDARGFDPVAPRAIRQPLRFAPWEPWLLALALGFSLSIVGARLLYLLYASDSLYIPQLRPLYSFVRGWL